MLGNAALGIMTLCWPHCMFLIIHPDARVSLAQASVYLMTALTAPRFTMLWLWLFDYETTIQRVRETSVRFFTARLSLNPQPPTSEVTPPTPPVIPLLPAETLTNWGLGDPPCDGGQEGTPVTDMSPACYGDLRDLTPPTLVETVQGLASWLGFSPEECKEGGQGEERMEVAVQVPEKKTAAKRVAVVEEDWWFAARKRLLVVLDHDLLFWFLWLVCPGLQVRMSRLHLFDYYYHYHYCYCYC
jgi:hypothetical protein